MNPSSAITQRSTRLPNSLVYATLILCLLPFFLNLLGIDFGTHSMPLGPMPSTDELFHALAGGLVHTILEWSAFSIAAFTTLLTFVHYQIKREVGPPIIGMALLCAGVMDGFHTLAADRLIDAVAPNHKLIPFTWALSQSFHVIILAIGALVVLFSPRFSEHAQKKRWLLPISGISFFILAYAIIGYCATSPDLPQTMYPEAIFSRPLDVLPLVLWIVCGVLVFWPFHKAEQSLFSHALLISVIPQVATEAYMAFGSSALFDNAFNIAHGLKVVGYFIPLYGLLLEYMETQREAQRQSALLEALLESIPDGVLMTNPKGELLHHNGVSRSILERKIPHSAPQTWAQYFGLYFENGHQPLPGNQFPLIPAMKERKRQQIELFIKNDQIEEGKYLSTSASPVYHKRSNRLMGGVMVFRDKTQLKKIELDLIDEKEKAQAAAKTKSVFLANMSHEIRTPMNGILGMSTLLLESGLNADQNQMVQTIRRSGDMLLTVINDILDFSKLEMGKTELEHQPFLLNSAVGDVLSILAPKAREKGIKLEYLIKKGTPNALFGDVTRFNQILTNLIGNAIKFTDEGSVCTTISASYRADFDKYTVTVEVRDTGIGISDTNQEKLFRAFSQADASTTRIYGGSGLGLAICKQLTELMGGRIWVESRLGFGSRFYFTIQAQAANEEYYITRTSHAFEFDKTMGRSHPLRILVVEDNSTNQQIAIRFLDKMGYVCDIAANGQEAVDMSLVKAYDLLFMDMQMPVMDGLTATQEIRQRDAYQPRIVAMTANAMRGDREQCLRAGMDDYISKPIDLQELQRALAETSRLKTGEIQATRPLNQGHPHPAAITEMQKNSTPAQNTEAPNDQTDIIDIDYLDGNFGTIKDILTDIVEKFHEDYPKLLGETQEALEAHDLDTFKRKAHTIKGAASGLGGIQVAKLAHELENGCTEGLPPTAQNTLKALSESLAQLAEALDAYLGKPAKRSSTQKLDPETRSSRAV